MSAHDPLCPSQTHGLLCSCALIRTIRVDQDTKSRADERERIARDCED